MTAEQGCGAVYVELGQDPAFDQVAVCARLWCSEHPAQLDWVRSDPGRVAAYAELAARLPGGEGVVGEQVSLL